MKLILSITLMLTVNFASAQQLTLLRSKAFNNFPSASAIEYYNNRLYVFGDDAATLLVLDRNYKILQQLSIFKSNKKRLDKETKADIEAAAIANINNKPYLMGISSFSTPVRNKVFFSSFPLRKNFITPDYEKVKSALLKKRITEINIEGAAFVQGRLLLSNRANTTNRNNHLISIKLNNGQPEDLQVYEILLPDTSMVKGISGLHYVPEYDLLLFTASVEDTPNAYDDGKIGESYFGYVLNFRTKIKAAAVAPDFLVNLSEKLKLKGDNKIESVTVESFTPKEWILHFVADNDKGMSTIYKVKMKL